MLGTNPSQSESSRGRLKRSNSPTSVTSASAVSASMPEKERRRATSGHNLGADSVRFLGRTCSEGRS
jgi:hypothetical protein